MSKRILEQLSGGFLLNDSGLETTLVFHEGRDLPAFAAFPLLENPADRAWLHRYFARHLEIAERHGAGFILDLPTWRANPDWGAQLGYDAAALARVNADAVAFGREVRAGWADRVRPLLISGVIGPRGDGYVAGRITVDEAERYHGPQAETLARAGADLVAGYTLTTVEEAIGIARAAEAVGVPSVISFTVETNGRLPDGTSLEVAIETVDTATDGAPAYYMINCAHPTHFAQLFADRPSWATRIRGLKANASTLSHAELDSAESLDEGEPADLGRRYRALRALLPTLTVLGGCCGTDHRHVRAIADSCCTDVQPA